MIVLGPSQRFVRAINRRRDGVRCDRCAEPLRRRHHHLVDLDAERLLCACQGCALLAAESLDGPYRVVPERVLQHPGLAPSADQWDSFGIPLGLAFFVCLSRIGRWVAVMPSAAGATEVGLPQAAWSAFLRGSLPAQDILPDVEALLARGGRGGPLEGYVVPIDLCYELVSVVRQTWRGPDGGELARVELDAFFERLRRRGVSGMRIEDTPAPPRTDLAGSESNSSA